MSFLKSVGKTLICFDRKIDSYFAKKWHWFITVPATIVILIALYFAFCFSTVPYTNNGFRDLSCAIGASILTGIIVLACVLYLLLEGLYGLLTSQKAIRAVLIIASTFLVLWGFTNALNVDAHHHDSAAFGTGNHWTIIYDIFSTGKIPAVNLRNQYYQPKSYHAILAGLMHFNMLFIRLGDGPSTNDAAKQARFPAYTISAYQSLEFTRVLMLIMGIVSLYAIYRIYTGLGFKGKKLAFVTALTILIPEFYFIQFFLNNDGFALTFSLVALALALQFKRSEKLLPLLFAALTLGLAMMIKINAALIAIPIAAIFVYVLVKKFRGKSRKDISVLLGKFALFAVIVFPLGLWVPVYYKITYDVPFGYVLDLTPTLQDKINYGMYIDPDFYNFFERCVLFPTEDFFWSPFSMRWRPRVDGVYVNRYGTIDFNCWTGFFKSTMFDEWGDFFSRYGIVGGLLVGWLYAEILLAFLAIFAGLYYVVRFFARKQYKNDLIKPLVLLVILLTYTINYVYFVNRYPVGCSQNARYVMPLLIPIQAIVGSMLVDLFGWTKWWKKKARASIEADQGNGSPTNGEEPCNITE